MSERVLEEKEAEKLFDVLAQIDRLFSRTSSVEEQQRLGRMLGDEIGCRHFARIQDLVSGVSDRSDSSQGRVDPSAS